MKVAGLDDETGEALVQREDDKAESVRNRSCSSSWSSSVFSPL